MGWMIISFIIALLVLYKLSSILGFYEEEEGGFGKKSKMKDLNNLFGIGENNENQENEAIKVKNVEIENEIFRSLNQKSQENVQKIHEVEKEFSLNFIKMHCDLLFSTLLKEFHEGKFENLMKYSNEIFLASLNDFLKQKKFDRTLVKIDSIEIINIDIDESFNSVISAKIISEQMEKEGSSFKSRVYENELSIGKALKTEGSEWIILDCKNLIV